jgi:hypothetical protein
LQDDIVSLKQQLNMERQAAAAAQELRAAAVEQLHLAEQQHQQQLLRLEENVKGFKWKLWEVEADASARRANTGFDTQQQQQQQQQSKYAWKLEAVGPRGREQDVMASDGEEVSGVEADAAVTSTVGGAGGTASAAWAGSAGRFSVELVARPGAADQVEMLPEVVRLFELHRSTMSRAVV